MTQSQAVNKSRARPHVIYRRPHTYCSKSVGMQTFRKARVDEMLLLVTISQRVSAFIINNCISDLIIGFVHRPYCWCLCDTGYFFLFIKNASYISDLFHIDWIQSSSVINQHCEAGISYHRFIIFINSNTDEAITVTIRFSEKYSKSKRVLDIFNDVCAGRYNLKTISN